jgi:isocitrate lyase
VNSITSIAHMETELLETEWATNPRWAGIERSYSAADVVRLRGSAPEPLVCGNFSIAVTMCMRLAP